MVTFTNSGNRDPFIPGRTGAVKTYVAAGRIAFGAAVVRYGAGTIKGMTVKQGHVFLGIALGDEAEHTYDGFYESGEPVPVALSGAVNALVTTIGATDIIAGDYLDHPALSSGTDVGATGLLAESNTNAGATKELYSHCMALEDVTLTGTYQAPNGAPTNGEYTVTMTTGGPTTMALQNGDYVLLRDQDGTVLQMNKVVTVADTLLTLEIPIAVTTTVDMVHAIKPCEVLIIR